MPDLLLKFTSWFCFLHLWLKSSVRAFDRQAGRASPIWTFHIFGRSGFFEAGIMGCRVIAQRSRPESRPRRAGRDRPAPIGRSQVGEFTYLCSDKVCHNDLGFPFEMIMSVRYV